MAPSGGFRSGASSMKAESASECRPRDSVGRRASQAKPRRPASRRTRRPQLGARGAVDVDEITEDCEIRDVAAPDPNRSARCNDLFGNGGGCGVSGAGDCLSHAVARTTHKPGSDADLPATDDRIERCVNTCLLPSTFLPVRPFLPARPPSCPSCLSARPDLPCPMRNVMATRSRCWRFKTPVMRRPVFERCLRVRFNLPWRRAGSTTPSSARGRQGAGFAS